VKASLSKQLGTGVNAFDDMFLVEFFEHIDNIQRKIEDERDSKMHRIISG